MSPSAGCRVLRFGLSSKIFYRQVALDHRGLLNINQGFVEKMSSVLLRGRDSIFPRRLLNNGTAAASELRGSTPR
jgi:hypothetical protein